MLSLRALDGATPRRRRQIIQGILVGTGGFVAASLLAACGGQGAAATTESTSAAAPAAASSGSTSAAPTTSAAATTTESATASSGSTTSAAPTTSAAASTTESATVSSGSTTSAAASTAKAAAAGPPQHGAVVPTPRNQTVVLDQTTFHVFDSFNPFIPNGQEYEAGFQQTCKEFLFYANYAAGKIQPWLATGWKYNTDNTELTLSLNDKAHWSDGQPFTAKDVVFTITMLQKNTALLTGGDIRKFVDSVSAPDDHTVTIKLKTPNPRFHYGFVCGIVGGFEVVPEHLWSKQDPLSFRDNPPVRTGPYKLDQVIPNQLMFVWKKDPNYWNKATMDPQPQYVVYRSAPVVDSQVDEFKRAATDLAGFDYQHMKAVQNGGYKNILIESAFRDPCPRGMWINSDPSKGALADPRMHWVLSSLLDRQKIGSTIWLIATPPAQYPWADYKSNSTWENADIAKQNALTYDPKKAASLLDDMGATLQGGKRMFQGKQISIEIMTPTLVGDPEYQIGALVVDELKKLGVDATVRSYSGPVWSDKFALGQFDVSSHWLCGVSFDPDQLYTGFETDKAVPIGQRATNGNEVRLHDQALNDDATKLDVTSPADTSAKPLFDKGLGDYYKALPAIPVIQTTYPVAFNTTYWTGWPSDDNLYQVPLNWWGQFLFVIGAVKPTGHA